MHKYCRFLIVETLIIDPTYSHSAYFQELFQFQFFLPEKLLRAFQCENVMYYLYLSIETLSSISNLHRKLYIYISSPSIDLYNLHYFHYFTAANAIWSHNVVLRTFQYFNVQIRCYISNIYFLYFYCYFEYFKFIFVTLSHTFLVYIH